METESIMTLHPELEHALMNWWSSKCPPFCLPAQHRQHPWLNVFGPEETALAVAIASGNWETIEYCAWAWFNSAGHTVPHSQEGIALDAVMTKLSINLAPKSAPTEGATMRCHKVTLKGKCERYAGTGEDAKWFRDTFIETFKCTKKDVVIEQVEIPTAKDDLLEFVNNLLTRIDEETAGE
jgi:hypothetical protein